MPFTVSHTVAAIPFNKGIGKYSKYTALSPLIIGSMTPDFAYLIPSLLDQRMDSHTLIGVYLFCVPMGLTIYFLYHLLMAPVLVSILPRSFQKHLNSDLFIGKLPTTPAQVIVISLVLGALTHIIWDSFTHQSGVPQHFPSMEIPLMTIGGYDVMSYRVIQYLSSILGLVLLYYWIARWYKLKKDLEGSTNYWHAPRTLKILSILVLTIIPISRGFIHLHTLSHVKHAFLFGTSAFLLCCLGLGLLYQLRIKIEN